MAADADKIVSMMLKENTGTHFMDSGGEGGRAWQQNQKRDFQKEAASVIEVDVGRKDLIISMRTFFYVTEFWESTTESERLQKEFLKFADREENEGDGWMSLMEKFYEEVLYPEIDDHDWNAYNVGKGGRIVNTYNYESSVDQILQYMMFSWQDNCPFIMLQIHGGADARGGYTAPHFFAFKTREHHIDEFLICDGDYTVMCGDEQWYTDDHGCHWYFEGSSSRRSMGSSEFAVYIGKFLGVTDETLKFEGDLYGCVIGKEVGRILKTPEKRTQAYDVYLRGRLIDTVFYNIGGKETISDVKKSLVDHDHYDPAIVVTRGR